MRRWLALLLLPLCVQAGELAPAWRHWQYFRVLENPAQAGWLRATLPPEMFGPARDDLADLRVTDGVGIEIPYFLHAHQEQCERTWHPATLSDTGFIPGSHSQAVVDAGSEGAPHNAVEVQLAQKDFFVWTEIAASDDRITWRIVRERAPLYRFERDQHADGQVLSYPLTRSRWLRLRFLDEHEALAATAVRIAQETRSEAELRAIPAQIVAAAKAPQGESRFTVDLGRNRPPVAALRFKTDQAEFHRAVIVSVSDDDKHWRQAGQGHIYRFARHGDSMQDQALQVGFPETRARYWRISTLDRNDPSLPGLQIELLGVPRTVVFKSTGRRDYRLLYGNARATAPHYELARLARDGQWLDAPAAAVGEEQLNAAFASPEPWSERHPWLLWSALFMAVGMLSWVALHALRQDHGDKPRPDIS